MPLRKLNALFARKLAGNEKAPADHMGPRGLYAPQSAYLSMPRSLSAKAAAFSLESQ
jgi:hypothetical protein